MADGPIWQWSACDVAEAVAAGKISASDSIDACVKRMRAANGALNAVVDDLGDDAIAEAKKLDDAFARSGPVGPLHGVAVTIKENVDQKGKATPNGVEALKDIIAPDDAPLVRSLRNAGAVVIGRTNTPEFSFRATTTNPLHGRTVNPWNDWASPGGSSGGASSAVMSGMGAIAHGNDIGGSLRFPSAATGATTVKPGLGRVPAWNPSQKAERGMLAQVMSVQGAICREVKDVRLAMRTLVQPDPHDPWQAPVPFDGPKHEGRVNVAFTTDTFDCPIHPEVEKALLTARDQLVDAGYNVVEIDPPNAQEIGTAGYRALMGEASVLMLEDIRKYGSKDINDIFDAYFEMFPPYEGDELIRALAQRSYYVRQWMLFMADYPLVLTPFLPNPSWGWNRDAEGVEGAREVLGYAYWSFAMNYMGLPAGIISPHFADGMPVSIQIVGNRFREDMILDALEAIESRSGVMAERLFARA